ncbi:MAG: PQQ-binding-like beta-propeller repeat protein [Planctomycetes bacterium]|nr:PQQ-binding-like beta-propeller repeat protein [Planctomycetota bacterium]
MTTQSDRTGGLLAIIALLGSTAWSAIVPHCLLAGDWPQILGPERNGHAQGEKLAPWSGDSLSIAWSHPLGQGYAGPAVVKNRIIVFHRVGDSERVEALEPATGRSIWSADFAAKYAGGVDPDTGPRCVPLIHEGRVYVFGAAGNLHCLNLADGNKVWSRAVYEEFSGLEGYFGAGSTPLVMGDKLLVNAGGRDDAGLVALALADGRTIWKATDERASYASPTAATFGSRQYAVFVTRMNAMAVRPDSGEVLFSTPFGQRGPTVNAATPLVFDDYLFLTASYGIGAQLLQVRGDSVTTVWANDRTLSSQYPTPVYDRGVLYGIHGREDLGSASLRAIDAKSGRIQWSVDNFGMAHLILADAKLLILTVNGRLILAEAKPGQFQVLAEARVSSRITRALPALAAGRLFVRETTAQGGTLKCVVLPN